MASIATMPSLSSLSVISSGFLALLIKDTKEDGERNKSDPGSSLRNAIRRRNHKERSQPLHRQKLGFLEKHKDYVKRARDYHSKRDRLTKLRQKAELKNKDEFYFGMVGKKTESGQHFQERGNTPLPNDLVKVLKTQDNGYIYLQRAINQKRIYKLVGNLSSLANIKQLANEEYRMDIGLDEYEEYALKQCNLIPSDEPKKSRKRSIPDYVPHIVFTDDSEPYFEPTNPVQEEDDHNDDAVDLADLGWKLSKKEKKRSKKKESMAVDEEHDAVDGNDGFDDVVVGETQLKKTLNELTQRVFRQDAMDRAARELELTKALMGKGAKQKLEKGQKTDIDAGEQEGREGKARVFKWRAERSK
ncbi:hypothetical protein E3P80_00530 [Wallemia ichthyophaga]|nr:hypothetical protein E3P85_01856 [Wallemia ichthyophaga]TIB50290.1 hypothetical protein E3P82_00530 [Wallemia ichthyophaga]TIB56507.1 hypothetical protein E3P80_00530 [Wallemia ichthyophaga]TIB61496.1 hypothetical protein E3P79_00531 [Wallemia ichthyophaga]